jgi:DMSO/TMAO reductase YedYZ molybdopterin-dependent catalytic subunit
MPDDVYQLEQPPTAEGLSDDVVVSPDTLRPERLPPRQVRTRKWPVLDAGQPAPIPLPQWTFEVTGLVERPARWSWEEFQRLPRGRVFADVHCVTRWSRLGNLWAGVATQTVLEQVKPLPDARYVLVRSEEGWTTNMPLSYFAAEDALFADHHDGRLLPPEHGGPLRLVVPRLYSWKSAKWVRGLEFLARDRAGFWEQGGYHMRGDPWREERFR